MFNVVCLIWNNTDSVRIHFTFLIIFAEYLTTNIQVPDWTMSMKNSDNVCYLILPEIVKISFQVV